MWTRFSQIVSFELGKTPDRHTDKFWSNGIYPWFAISDLQERSTVSSAKEKISATALKEKFAGKLVPQGTLLMSFKLTVGRTSILGVDAVHNEAIISVFPIIPDKDATRNFLFNLLPLIVEYVETTDAIKGATLNSSKLYICLSVCLQFHSLLIVFFKICKHFLKSLKQGYPALLFLIEFLYVAYQVICSYRVLRSLKLHITSLSNHQK